MIINCLDHDARIGTFLIEREVVSTPPFLVCSQHTVINTRSDRSIETEMVGSETVVLTIHLSVIVVDGRTIERIAHHHSPVLPSGIYVMIVVIVFSAYMHLI